MLPEFNQIGNLPAGIHLATWEEFVDRFGWNEHRRRLLRGMRTALKALQFAGCRKVYIDGSFVSAKEAPNDYDGCWDMEGVDPLRLDPILLQFDYKRAAQKTKYLGELFPAEDVELSSGVVFLELFQIDKATGEPKGIILFDLEDFQ